MGSQLKVLPARDGIAHRPVAKWSAVVRDLSPSVQLGAGRTRNRQLHARRHRTNLNRAAENFPTTNAFRAQLKQQLAVDAGEAAIFVHGFNTNFAEGVYRVAQLSHGLKLPGTLLEHS